MPISEVFCMDCLDYMRSIPDKFFALAVVDPPYGINAPVMSMGSARGNFSTADKLRKGRLNGGAGKLKNRALNTMSCDWDFSPPPPEYFDELRRVSKNQIIWGGNYFPLPPTRGIICWDKLQPWENFSQVELAWTSFDIPAKIVRISTTGGNNREEKIHPTQKPVSLYSWLFKKFAGRGGKILDTHLGSQSSRIAAYYAGLDFYGCEIDPGYFKSGCARFDKICRGIENINGHEIQQLNLFNAP